MAKSEEQEKIINLGKLLVKELELETGNDTLSRWMAHYLAEKISIAEQLEGKEKEIAEKECFDFILKLWQHFYTIMLLKGLPKALILLLNGSDLSLQVDIIGQIKRLQILCLQAFFLILVQKIGVSDFHFAIVPKCFANVGFISKQHHSFKKLPFSI